MPSANGRVYQHLVRLRWALPLIVLALAALHQVLLGLLLDRFPQRWQGAGQLAVYGITGIIVAWIGLTWLIRAVGRQERAEADLRRAYADLERTHHELQTIHELGRQIVNAADVPELLDIAAQMPVRLLGARGTSVVTLDREARRAQLEMTWGLGEEAVSALRREVEAGLPADRCAACRPLTAQFADHCPLLEPLQAAGCAGDIRRAVCLPLTQGRERLGVIVAYLADGPAPTSEQLHLLNILATELTAALEGVRLRARQIAALYAVERVQQEHRELDDLLKRALRTILGGWGADRGALLLAEGAEGAWRIRAHEGWGDEGGMPGFDVALRLAEQARGAADAVILADGSPPDGLASAAVVPLTAEGRTLGVLVLGASRPGVFTPAAGNLLTPLAHQVALAIRNAQLYAQVRQLAVLEERHRLSREMHDGLAQTLGYLGLEAERLDRLAARGRIAELREGVAALRRAVADAYADVREATEGLRLAVDQPGGLPEALRDYVDDFARRTGLAVECAASNVSATLPAEVAVQLLRIAQEALTNVRRHAHATRAWVALREEPEVLELKVADDGCGFAPAVPGGRGHLGLATMRERARSLNGRFSLATAPGRGTVVTVRVAAFWQPAGARESPAPA